MNKVLERSKRFCGYLVGIVFFLSGMAKLLDPVGAGLVMDEYLDFLHLTFLGFASKSAAVTLALTETLTGAALITGLWRKPVAIITLAFLGFFTILTLILVIFNPTMDCGCFGEIVHLTHLQSFLKNIILLALACASFFPFKYLGKPKKRKYVTFSVVSSLVVSFMIYSLLYIPLQDFTDFKPGTRLSASPMAAFMENPADEAFEAIFIYEKNGRRKQFTLDALPDSTWTFVSTETVRKSENRDFDGPVALPIMDAHGTQMDELAAAPSVLVISVYKPNSISQSRWKKIAALLEEISQSPSRPLLLVAAVPDDYYKIIDNLDDQGLTPILRASALFSDYKTLVSLNRSNAGVTYFSEGFLVRKWSSRNWPDIKKNDPVTEADITETFLAYSSGGPLVFQGILLFAFAAMLLL